jgi:hypothetical protein
MYHSQDYSAGTPRENTDVYLQENDYSHDEIEKQYNNNNNNNNYNNNNYSNNILSYDHNSHPYSVVRRNPVVEGQISVWNELRKYDQNNTGIFISLSTLFLFVLKHAHVSDATMITLSMVKHYK